MVIPAAVDYMRTINETDKVGFYYISDLALKPKDDLQSIADAIAKEVGVDSYLCINGNVSEDFGLCTQFLTSLSEKTDPRKVILVPGDFESGSRSIGTKAYDDRMAKYREVVEGLHMAFLDGQLMILKDGCRNIYEINDLLNASEDDLREEMDLSGIAVFGCSAFDENRKALYVKMLKEVPSSRIIIVTTDFEMEYNLNWIYVCRKADCPPGMRVFTDADSSPRMFEIPAVQSATMSLRQGMRVIKPEEYRAFYTKLGKQMTYKNGRDVTVLTEGGYTMFLTFVRVFTTTVLDVNSPFKHEHSWDIFKADMAGYGDRIRTLITPYYLRVREISALVRSIGGEGTINGCTVNVFEDLNIFIDPKDNGAILYTNVKGGMDVLRSFPEEFSEGNGTIELKADPPEYVNRKDMRRMIQVTEAMMSVVDDSIIRRWDDRVLEGAGLPELIVEKDVRMKEDD